MRKSSRSMKRALEQAVNSLMAWSRSGGVPASLATLGLMTISAWEDAGGPGTSEFIMWTPIPLGPSSEDSDLLLDCAATDIW
jgi:hypothetical protein